MNPLSPLSKIQQVDAPPFLLTRIEQAINRAQRENVSPTLAWSLGVSFLFVFTVNVTVISNQISRLHQPTIIETMHLSPTNTLYYD